MGRSNRFSAYIAPWSRLLSRNLSSRNSFSIIAGVCVAFMRVSRYRSVRGSVLAYVEFIRCTPALVQLYYIFYVIPIFGLTLEALTAGIVGFTIIYTAYLSEVFRAAINSVAKPRLKPLFL